MTRNLHSACVIFTLLLLSASCAGGASTHALPAAALAPAAAAGLPALPADEAFGGHMPLPRAASARATVDLSGAQIFAAGPGCVALPETESASFAATDGAAAWALYRFSELAGAAQASQLSIELVEAPELPEGLWLAIGDYSSGRWRFLPAAQQTALQTLSLPPDLEALSPQGNVYVALLLYDPRPVALAKLSLSLDLPAPPPLQLTASQGSSAEGIELSWQAPAGVTAEGWIAERAAQPEGPWQQLGGQLPAEPLVFLDSHEETANPLPPGQRFHYRLRTVAGGFSGPPSQALSGYRGSAPLAHLKMRLIGDNAPYAVELDAAQSSDPDGGGLVRYEWDWDDDGSYDFDSGAEPLVTHPEPYAEGSYKVRLRLSDDEGMQAVTTVTVSDFMHSWGTALADEIFDLAADEVGNVYAVGGSAATGGLLYFKYSAEGVLLWLRSWLGPLYDRQYPFDMVLDPSGTGYVSAVCEGGEGKAQQLLLLSFDAEGELQWQKSWGGPGEDTAAAITYSCESLYVAGRTQSYGAGNSDGLLIKLGFDGTLIGKRSWGGPQNESFSDLIMREEPHCLFMAGTTDGFGEGGTDALLLGYDSTGAVVISNSWGSAGDERLERVILNGAGGLMATGSRRELAESEGNILLLSFDAAGTASWARVWGGAAGEDSGTGLVLDPDGSVRLAGYGQGFGEHAADYDGLLLHFSAAGLLLDSRLWTGGGSRESFGALSRGAAGELLLGGISPRARTAGGESHGEWIIDPQALQYEAPGQLTLLEGLTTIPPGAFAEGSCVEIELPEGLPDTGAGDDDALIMRIEPPA